MTAEQYERWAGSLRRRPAAVRTLIAVNRALMLVGYVAYPLLLLIVLLQGDSPLLARCVLAPGLAFAAVTFFRAWRDAPRPFEALPIEPLIPRGTQGKSFPSRHTFSLFMIALAWLAVQPVVGIVLLLLACVLAVVRVLGGVHFPRDVIAGAAFAIAAFLLGFVLI